MTECNVIALTGAELKEVLISLAEGNHCVYLFCASLSLGLIDLIIEHGFGLLYIYPVDHTVTDKGTLSFLLMEVHTESLEM